MPPRPATASSLCPAISEPIAASATRPFIAGADEAPLGAVRLRTVSAVPALEIGRRGDQLDDFLRVVGDAEQGQVLRADLALVEQLVAHPVDQPLPVVA